MRIDRHELLERLSEFSLSGHGVVTGAPGVGKTVAISQLAERLLNVGRGIFIASVDEFAAIDRERTFVTRDGGWIDTLREFFDARTAPGVVVIDGFDAARDPAIRRRAVALIGKLIDHAAGRWNVVVTVRQYDAAKSPDLMALFPAGGRAGTRMFEVPLLTWGEVEQAESAVDGLSAVIRRASPPLRDLLRLPFNLWLVEQILRSSAEEAVGELSQVETEVQLLDQFWRSRVSGGSNGPARASLARRAAARMVASQRLSVPVGDVWDHDSTEAWDVLLSAEVLALSGPSESRVGFGHNILFDYAAGAYVLSSDPDGLKDFLSEVPARALFLRPSLVFLFSNLWNHDRPQFWRLFKGLSGATELAVRLVVRLIPSYVLASRARSIADLRPLRDNRWRDNTRAHQWAMQAARFTPSLRADVWSKFVADLMHEPDPVYAWEAALLLRRILVDSKDDPNRTAREHKLIRTHIANGAARLLAYALQRRRDSDNTGKWWADLASRQALPLVLETMEVRLKGAARLIRDVLALLDEPDVPIWFFFALSEHIRTIARLDPRLAADIYTSVFSYEELSDSATPLGGAVIRLQSTRRQDYEGVQYGLIEAYSDFVTIAPIQAIGAGLHAGCSDVLKDGFLRFVTVSEMNDVISKRTRPIRLFGVTGQWLEDHSALFQRHGSRDGIRLIAAAANGVLELARSRDDRLQEALQEYARHASVSLAIARLFRVGATAPDVLADPLRELVVQRAIRMSLDLRDALGRFIKAAAPHWTIDARREVETSIVAVLDEDDSGVPHDQRSHVVNALIAAIPPECLVTAGGRERAAAIVSSGVAPSTEPVRFEAGFSEYTQEDWLIEQGVDPARAANRAVRSQVEPLQRFNDKWRNKPPTEQAAADIQVPLERAIEALRSADADDLVLREAWTAVAGTTAAIARLESFGPTDARWNFIRSLLTSALSAYPHAADENADDSFTWPHWSPSPQTEAVQGLGVMLYRSEDPIVLEHFEQVLLNDRDPALRFLAASSLLAIHGFASDRFWDLARTIAANERNAVVMAAFLGKLASLVRSHGDNVLHILQLVWPRWQHSTHKDVMRALGRLLLVLATHIEDDWAIDVLRDVGNNALEYDELLGDILFDASAALAPRVALQSHGLHIQRLRDLLTNLVITLKHIDVGLAERQGLDDVASERGSVHQMVGTIATRLDVNLRLNEGVTKETDAETLEACVDSYYHLIWPVVEAILDFGQSTGVLMARTAHHLLQLFNILIAVDPVTVVIAANRAVQAGKSDGYSLDSLAIREVVRLTETVLADERDVLLHADSMYALMELLDTFVEVGWTEALELIWRLDEAFR